VRKYLVQTPAATLSLSLFAAAAEKPVHV